MAELPAPQHPLQAMTAMSNLMVFALTLSSQTAWLILAQLVQTGKFFQNAASGNPKPLGLERKVLQATGASANTRFHDALDEVEVEIVSLGLSTELPEARTDR